MVAYACSPHNGSEAGAGWSWAYAASEEHNVVLFTRSKNVPGIVADPRSEVLGSVWGVDAGKVARAGKTLGRLGFYFHYGAWLRALRKDAQFQEEVREAQVLHVITLSNDWIFPSVLKATAPTTIWGPIGGRNRPDRHMLSFFGFCPWLSQIVKTLLGDGLRLVARLKAHRANVDVILCQNADTYRFFAKSARRAIIEQNIVLADISELGRVTSEATTGSGSVNDSLEIIEIICVGRLLRWKGQREILQILSGMPSIIQLNSGREVPWRLRFLGGGPDDRSLRKLVQKYGLSDRVEFFGQVERALAIDMVAKSNLLVLATWNDSAGWVLAEATAAGTRALAFPSAGPKALALRDRGIELWEPPSSNALSRSVQMERTLALAEDRPCKSNEFSVARLPAVLRDIYAADETL